MSSRPIEPDARSARMQLVMVEAAQYGSITPIGPFQIQVAQPAVRPNHVLHLLLSLITFGFWVIIWIIVSIFGRPEKRHIITVDEAGRVWVDGQRRTHGLGLR